MGEWETYKLGDLVNLYSGGTPNKANALFWDGDIPWISAKSMYEDYLETSDTFITELGLKNGTRLAKKGTILLLTRGSGLFNRIPVCWALRDLAYNQDVKNIVSKNESLVSTEYLYYWLYGNKDAISSILETTGIGAGKIDTERFLNLEVSLPSLNKQGHILRTIKPLFDKITLNNRINHNLEEQAQALYKSWFVDFEPFKDKEFVDSDLGQIPKEWRIRHAEDICPINIGKTPPRKETHWFSSEIADPIWVSISDMSDCGVFIDNSAEKLTSEAIKRFNVIIVPEDSVLLSFKLTIGRVAIANRSLTTNEAIARFVTNNKPLSLYLYLALLNYDYSKLGSTSSIATAVNSKIIKAMPILWPGSIVVERFAESIKPMFDEIKKRQAENRCLTALRDTALPKLMCGQLTC